MEKHNKANVPSRYSTNYYTKKSLSKIILIRNTNPDFYGGAETYQLTLAKILSQNNFTPIIFSSANKLYQESIKNKISCKKAPFLKCQNWSGLRNLLLPIYFFWQKYLYFWYKKQFKIINPSSIIVESRDDFLAATKAARKLKIQVIWLDHMDFRSWVLQNVEKKYKNIIGKRILQTAKQVDQIIFISDYERNYFEKLIKKTQYKKIIKKIITIKNGTIDQFDEYKNIKPEKQSLIYLGRLEEYKGIKELVTSFSQITSDFPHAKLHIYGSGSLSNFCKNYTNSQVIYHGFTNQPLEKIAASEIFILPSHIEGLSLSLIDAVMLGKAIITTDIDGNPEVVKDNINGLLVPPKNPKALEYAMRTLLSHPKLIEKFSKNSRIKFQNEFNYEDTVQKKLIPLLVKKRKNNE